MQGEGKGRQGKQRCTKFNNRRVLFELELFRSPRPGQEMGGGARIRPEEQWEQAAEIGRPISGLGGESNAVHSSSSLTHAHDPRTNHSKHPFLKKKKTSRRTIKLASA